MNYIGSKHSLLGFIDSVFNEVTAGMDVKVVADLFAGTSSVGKHFKTLGYTVIGNDLQFYSYVLGKHYLECVDAGMIDLKRFDELKMLDGVEGFIYNNYAPGTNGQGRMYFTNYNAKKVDAIRQKIEDWYKCGDINEYSYYYYLTSLIESIDKYANTASVYGAYLKHFKKTADREFILEGASIIESGHDHKMYLGDANININKIKADVIYIDPPYNTRQYNSNYHLLETIARYDNPVIHGKTGVRTYDDELKSDYSKKKLAVTALDDLISKCNSKVVMMSYNSEGIISMDDIERIFNKYGKYKLYKKDYKKFKSQKSQNDDYVFEYIHVLIKE